MHYLELSAAALYLLTSGRQNRQKRISFKRALTPQPPRGGGGGGGAARCSRLLLRIASLLSLPVTRSDARRPESAVVAKRKRDAAEVSAIFALPTCVISIGSAGSVRWGRVYCYGVIHQASPTALYTAYVVSAQCVSTITALSAPTAQWIRASESYLQTLLLLFQMTHEPRCRRFNQL